MSNRKTAVIFVLLALSFSFLLTAVSFQKDPPAVPKAALPTVQPKLTMEEIKRIDLYVMVMKRAFQTENGGERFIAVDFDTLNGLSEPAKELLLKKMEGWAKETYKLSEIKSDRTKLEVDIKGRRTRTIDGTILSVRVEKESENKVTLWGTSWFGNLGAVMVKYEATYEAGVWTLKEIGFAMA